MSLQIRRYLLALTLGVAGVALAMPFTHSTPAFAEDDGASADHKKLIGDDIGSPGTGASDDDGEAGDDDDAGAVGGAPKGTFQEGCAITDLNCLNQKAK